MSLVDTSLAHFPPWHLCNNAGASLAFNSGAISLALIGRIPKTGTIVNVHYRTSAISAPVMTQRAELRTVNATTGVQDAAGSLYGGSTSITVTDAAITTGNKTAAVNASATAGEVFAFVLDTSSYTSGSFTIRTTNGSYLGSAASGRNFAFPYRVTSGVKDTGGNPWQAVVLEYSGGEFVQVMGVNNWVGDATSQAVTNSGTVRVGNAFTPPTPRRAVGMYMDGLFTGGIVLRVRLASDDSILATVTPDKDILSYATSGQDQFVFDSGTQLSLAAGVGLYLTMEGTDATGGTLNGLTAGVSQAMLGAVSGGQNCYGVTHNGAAYTTYLTANNVRRYGIGLITDQEDDGTGGGGGDTVTREPTVSAMISNSVSKDLILVNGIPL